MKIALFIVYPVHSHYNITLSLARCMKDRGYRVVFTGIGSQYKMMIEEQNFEFINISYMYEVDITSWKSSLGFFLLNAFQCDNLKRRYREFLNFYNNLTNICKELSPDKIFIDEHLNFYYFLLYNRYACFIINTKLPTGRHVGIPPLNSSKVFRGSHVYRVYSLILWIKFMVQVKYYKALKKIAYLGLDEFFFLNKLYGTEARLYEKYVNEFNILHDGIKNVPVIHLVPKELEYSWYKTDKHETFFYKKNKKVNSLGNVFIDIIQSYLEKKSSQKKTIIYASLGTLSQSYSQIVFKFFSRLMNSVKKDSNIHLVIADKYLFENKKFINIDNVDIYDWIPQADFLSCCDLVITHGGTNTILECVEAGIPMISYPLNLSADHPGNSARVVYNGWGIQGDIRKDNENKIYKKILFMLKNKEKFCKRIEEYKPPYNSCEHIIDFINNNSNH